MSTPAPLRHVRAVVGVFNLLLVALLLVAVLLVGHGRRWFERRAVLDVTFPAASAAVLRPGVPVKLAGDPVGGVVAVAREKDLIRARLSISAEARETLREDARAQLRVPIAGLVGDLGIALDPGGAPAPLPDGTVLAGVAEGDPADKARETVDRVRDHVPALLERTEAILAKADQILGQVERARTAENADRLVRSLDRLAAQMEKERLVANAAGSLAELEKLLREVREGGGTAGKLLSDAALYDRITALLDDVHQSWSKVDALVAASGRLAERADELAASARGRSKEIEELVSEVQLLVLQSNRALDVLNSHWLFRGAVPEPGVPVPPGVVDLPDDATAAGEGRP
jgi:ABC-type transporter Mla subunit MlaD